MSVIVYNGLSQALFTQAIEKFNQGQYEGAIKIISPLLVENKDNANLHSFHAACLLNLGNFKESLGAILQAIHLSPDSAVYQANAGVVYQYLSDFDNALKHFDLALDLDRQEHTALMNKPVSLLSLRQYQDAITACHHGLAVYPASKDLWNILADVYLRTCAWHDAVDACHQGIRLAPDFPYFYQKRGIALACLKRFSEAQLDIECAARLSGYEADAYGTFLDARQIFMSRAYDLQLLCDWRLYDDYAKVLQDYVAESDPLNPDRGLAFRQFSFPVSDRLEITRKISQSISSNIVPKPLPVKDSKRRRLRIGYLSPDFWNHPTAMLSRQLYALHDRERFKIYAYSLTKADTGDAYTRYIQSQCDVFRDVTRFSHQEVAEIIAQDQIDILVDLAGYTNGARTEILAFRPAPLQISYLGFVASMGADFIDYAIVDHYVCPHETRSDWREALIRLPDSLYLYDDQIENKPKAITRADYNLPDDSVIYCCFNHHHKIDPELFNVWMHILKEVPDSVIWLLVDVEPARRNLQEIALAHGVDVHRIVFADRLPPADHLARYHLADIFLDTYWFNGHTTTLEALWQGLPVLTRCGKVTSSRVAASFLHVLGLPELVTDNYENYQQKAVYYAQNRSALLMLKQRLLNARKTSPLFNTALTVRQIELAYEMAWSRHQSKMEPTDIDVPAVLSLR